MIDRLGCSNKRSDNKSIVSGVLKTRELEWNWLLAKKVELGLRSIGLRLSI